MPKERDPERASAATASRTASTVPGATSLIWLSSEPERSSRVDAPILAAF